jgi:hypothetical protein
MRACKRKAALSALTLALIAPVLLGVSVATASTSQQHAVTWLAAGDSFASGAGLEHTTEPCAQGTGSGGATARMWAVVTRSVLATQTATTHLSFDSPRIVACTGAISKEFFQRYNKSPAQWTPSMGRFDLVTFSFGGDDIGFTSIVEHCLTIGCPSNTGVSQKISLMSTTGLTIGGKLIPPYPTFLQHVAKAAVSKGGNVVVMGYPEVVEDPTVSKTFGGGCEGFTEGETNEMRGWAGDLNATIGAAVTQVNALPAGARNDVHFTFIDPVTGQTATGISASDPYLYEPASGTRHELCSPGGRAWLNGLLPGHLTTRSFHPNQNGETAMGDLAAEVIPDLSWPWSAPLPFSADTGNFAYDSSFTNLQLDSVSCPADDDCVADGSDFEAETNEFTAVIEQWNGSAWAQVALPDAAGVDLSSVSCPSTTFCMAVGRTPFEGDTSNPVAYTWNGNQWSSASPEPSSSGEWVNLSGVSCVSTTTCVVVGAQESSDGSDENPFAEEWSSGSWQTPNVDPNVYGELLDVACPTGSSCTAVGGGGTQEGGIGGPLAYHWNGAALSNQPVPIPTADPDGQADQGGSSYELHSVSCPTDGSCIAVGDDGAVESLEAGSWKLDPSYPLDFVSISCNRVTRCLATGGGPGKPVIASGSAVGWHSVTQAASSPVTPQAVSSRPDGFAMVVGYEVGTEIGTPFAEDEPAP